MWFWGRGNVLINGVDTNFPLNPEIWFARRMFVWNSVINAGSDFSSSIAGLFFHSVQVIPYLLGLPLQQVELISFIFWFGLIVISSFIFARIIIPGKLLIQVLFVSLYSFNIYLFNSWENVKVANLALVAAIPLGLAILQKMVDGTLKYYQAFFLIVLTGIILSGSGINPAYFAVFFFVLLIYFLGGIFVNFNMRFFFRSGRDLIFVFIVLISVNLFWILPAAHFIASNISPTGSIDKMGFRNWVDSISENTSLLNVMRIQGAWDWYAIDLDTHKPFYIPYATVYFENPAFLGFSFLIPLLAIFSLIFRIEAKNNLYLNFGTMFILGTFLGAGTHFPTGGIYRFLSDHVPFFTLFRSPWYIFTPLVILSLAGLTSLLTQSILEKKRLTEWIGPSLLKKVVSLAAFVLILANLKYTYPQISGEIFRPGRIDGFFVDFPKYVFDAGNNLDNVKSGRIISYPDDEIESFKWGYRGIDSILALLSDHEVIFTPFSASDSPLAKIIRMFYTNLKKGQISAAENIAGKLGVSQIFYKNDQNSSALNLPPSIIKYANQQFGDWHFYDLTRNNFTPKIFIAEKEFFSYPMIQEEQAFAVLPQRSILLNPEDNNIKQISGIEEGSGRIFIAENSQVKALDSFKNPDTSISTQNISSDLSRVDYKFTLPRVGTYIPVLEKFRITDFGLDVASGLIVEIDGKTKVLEFDKSNDSYFYFKPVLFSAGQHIILIRLINKNLIFGGSFNDGISFEEVVRGENKGKFEIITDNLQNKYLSIINFDGKSMGARFEVSDFDPLSDFYLEIKYKQVYGRPANMLISQVKDDLLAKLQGELLPNYPEWRIFSTFYEPNRIGSKFLVDLEAPGTSDPLGTKVFYDDFKINRIFSNKLFLMNEEQVARFTPPVIEFEKSSPVLYEGVVRGGSKPHLIIFSENYSPQWRLSIFDEKGELPIKPLHFSANSYANGWFLDNMPENYNIRIYYQPQNLFLYGILVSSGVFIAALGIFLIFTIKNRIGRKYEKGS